MLPLHFFHLLNHSLVVLSFLLLLALDLRLSLLHDFRLLAKFDLKTLFSRLLFLLFSLLFFLFFLLPLLLFFQSFLFFLGRLAARGERFPQALSFVHKAEVKFLHVPTSL